MPHPAFYAVARSLCIQYAELAIPMRFLPGPLSPRPTAQYRLPPPHPAHPALFSSGSAFLSWLLTGLAVCGLLTGLKAGCIAMLGLAFLGFPPLGSRPSGSGCRIACMGYNTLCRILCVADNLWILYPEVRLVSGTPHQAFCAALAAQK